MVMCAHHSVSVCVMERANQSFTLAGGSLPNPFFMEDMFKLSEEVNTLLRSGETIPP